MWGKSFNEFKPALYSTGRLPQDPSKTVFLSATIYFEGSCGIGILLYSLFFSMESWIHHSRHIFFF